MKTVKIRIAVAVDKNGDWTCGGYSSCKTDDELKDCCFLDGIADGECFCFVEAEVPLPEDVTVQGEAK